MLGVRGLTKRYGGHLAVDGVSFSVNRGEVVGYLGPNRSGKSTTVHHRAVAACRRRHLRRRRHDPFEDNDTVSLGSTVLTAHHHPGHTKGATSFMVDVQGCATTREQCVRPRSGGPVPRPSASAPRWRR